VKASVWLQWWGRELPDIANNASTTSSITVGGSLSSQLEVVGDHDWVRIDLAAGQKITISLDGITVVDPYVYMRDASGTLLAENDDINPGLVRDSELVFTAPTAGTYYIDVAAWEPSPSDAEYPGFTGTYQLNVNAWAPPTVWTYAQIANQLTSGYWGGDVHHFNVAQGGTITVNLTALTGAGQGLAREALNLWSDIIGVTFTEVSSAGQIVFDDNQSGAFTSDIYSGGVTTSARVNISTQWLTDYGSGLNTYSFQTYLHEIGHALGLGHAGMYNNTANYETDARYANDAWPTTVMSYFGENENTYFSNLGFSFGYVNTPMLADIRAMATLYGLSTTTRAGDTMYGFNNNSGRSEYGAAVGSPLVDYTIFDTGGFDTLNYSGFSSNQTINLNPETFSNVGGGIGNVSIAFNTIIENALGGNGNDILIGNAVDNTLNGGAGVDTLTGGAGNDTFGGAKADLNGDTITDFAVGDKIVITDASLAGFSSNLSGGVLTFTGGSLNLQGVSGQLTASAAAGGGVQLILGQAVIPDVSNDFNGDGRSDVLWRSNAGIVTDWLGQANGVFAGNAAQFTAGTEWHILGSGDFNGDGRDDILWRSDAGIATYWMGQANGNFAGNTAYFTAGNDWTVVGTGDFNGDGRDDVLWRNASGIVTDWFGQANGTFTGNTAQFTAGNEWSIVGTGDFNGDGRDDILWRNSAGIVTDWFGQANGTFTGNTAQFTAGNEWSIVGTGDFNGDGFDDVLWRNGTSGVVTDWMGQANGTFAGNTKYFTAGTEWNVVGTGDYNGDGRDDILWRNGTGNVTDWHGQTDGSFTGNTAQFAADSNWHIQSDFML